MVYIQVEMLVEITDYKKVLLSVGMTVKLMGKKLAKKKVALLVR